jgi:hypothetical protein
MTALGGNMDKPIGITVRPDNEFMRVTVDMDIFSVYHDILCVTKQLCHFFKWNAFCLWQHEGKYNYPEAADNNKNLLTVNEGSKH